MNKDSLNLHRKLKGKLETKSKVDLNRDVLSLVYTPGVASVCEEIAGDKDRVYDYTIKSNCVAVISDGSAVLGLGNIGAEASLPVMEGKCVLFKELGGVDAFPICLRNQGVEGIVETIRNIAPVFGGINLEDFKAPECFEIERRLQDLGIPVMHDDQHATAIVVLAGLINSLKLRGFDKGVKIVVNGIGAAGTSIVKLLLGYGFENIIAVDKNGILCGDLSECKKEIAGRTNKEGLTGGLREAIKGADVFIGVSVGGVLSKEMVELMNDRPIVFALANPVPEIMPEEARDGGVFIVATGRSDFPNQVNNVLVFPGIFRGLLDAKAKRVSEEMKIVVAETLAGLVDDLSVDSILPDVLDKRVHERVGEAVMKFAKT